MHRVDCVGGFLGVVIQDGILIASTWRGSEMISMMTGVGVLEWHFAKDSVWCQRGGKGKTTDCELSETAMSWHFPREMEVDDGLAR